MTEHFDAIVIGTGQAGPALAVRRAAAGRKTAILERKRIGGTCVNVGCIPTKTLIASARAAHVARRGEDFGVMINGKVRIDMARVKARKGEIVAQSNHGVTNWIRKAPNVTLIESEGIAFRLNAQCLRIDKRDDGVGVHVSCEQEPRERSETQGFMQVLVDAEAKKILGAALLGIEADEAIHCIVDVMAAGQPYTAISRTVHIHPTVAELIPTLLGSLQPLQ
jgi:pyruvate/2-oxoglutarate dehydrogenase complex dihydrolipoamide dehydrogenase (E3) component